MVTLKKYSLDGKELGTVSVMESLSNAETNSQMVKDYIVALRANLRQWSASTKTRSEVAHSTKKPRPQKGSGNARQGSLVAPQFRGGGRVFTPRPKFDQHVRINRKERQAAIRQLLAEKFQQGLISVIASTEMDKPQTKRVTGFLKACNLEGRVLFVGEGQYGQDEVGNRISLPTSQHSNFAKSLHNLQKVNFSLAPTINGYDILLAKYMVVTEAALKEFEGWLG